MQNSNDDYRVKVPFLHGNQDDYPEAPPQYTVQGNQPMQHVIIRQPLMADPPKDYFVEAVLVTVLCFWPTGIAAIIKALDVQRAVAMGNREFATSSSASARKYVCLSVWLGVACIVLTCLLMTLYVAVILSTL